MEVVKYKMVLQSEEWNAKTRITSYLVMSLQLKKKNLKSSLFLSVLKFCCLKQAFL